MRYTAGMLRYLLVGAGGFVGSILRYSLGGLVQRVPGVSLFPAGTLFVNVVGCFLIGALAGVGESRGAMGSPARLFLMIGVLGGFTTFSSFGYETLALAREAEWLRAFSNVGLNVMLGLVAVWAGFALGRH